MGDKKIIRLRIDEVVFRKVDSTVFITYDMERDYISNVEVKGDADYADRYWYLGRDDCDWKKKAGAKKFKLNIKSAYVYPELADLIKKEKKWLYTYGSKYSSAKNPLTDDTIREAVIERLNSVPVDFAEFAVECMEKGDFKELVDKDGWMDAHKVHERLEKMGNAEIPFELMMNLGKCDGRFGSWGTKENGKLRFENKYSHLMGIRIDTVFDTAECTVALSYDTKRKVVSGCGLFSNLSKVSGSRYEWIDQASYGMCTLDVESLDMFAEVADSIKDKDWTYIKGGGVWNARNPLKDENFKQAVLKLLYTIGDEFRDFAVNNLKQGGFEKIMDSEGWMDIWKFKQRLEKMNDIQIPLYLLLDLPNRDKRFLAKGEYNFKTDEDTRKIKFSDK